MWSLESIKRQFSVPDDPELVLAQARALSTQVPLMYAMVVVNTVILAVSHAGAGPDLLTLYAPAMLSVLCVARIVSWLRGRQKLNDIDVARRSLRRMMRVMPLLSVGFSVWTVALLPYGNAYQQSQVVFFAGVTTIGCMFCLMHMRAAAVSMGALQLVPLTIAMLMMNNVVMTAIAINLGFVVAGVLIVLLGNYRDFADLVASRSAMARKQAETQRLSDENNRLANVDPLTGLPNRRWFDRQLDEMLGEANADGTAIAVARIDLDGFKAINQTFGQTTGDRVLAETARRISTVSPSGSFVARLGADNFALITRDVQSDAGLQRLGTELCRALRSPFDLPDANIHLSASIGFAASHPGDTAEMTYDRADYANSVAKRECRGHAVVFADRHDREIRKVRQIEHELHTADLDKEIHILFQRQFDTATNRTTGYEVLARWNSPVLGEVSPMEFIPLAEHIGLISKVTQTVLRKALAVSATLPKHIRLSVNLSAHDIGSATAIKAIAGLLKQAGTPRRIDFEITETAVMRDLDQANSSLLTLLALGSRIALDDFGTGHSSLTHVQRLPLDRIKVDRSFVTDICNDRTSQAIIKTTTELCRNLGISCVIEGVETQEELDVLVGLGGTVIQGYLFGRPVDAETMLAQLARERTVRSGDARRASGATN